MTSQTWRLIAVVPIAAIVIGGLMTVAGIKPARANHEPVVEGQRYETKLVALCSEGESIFNLTKGVQDAESMSVTIATKIAEANGCTFEPVSFDLTKYMCSIKRNNEFKFSVVQVTRLSDQTQYYVLGAMTPETPVECKMKPTNARPKS